MSLGEMVIGALVYVVVAALTTWVVVLVTQTSAGLALGAVLVTHGVAVILSKITTWINEVLL